MKLVPAVLALFLIAACGNTKGRETVSAQVGPAPDQSELARAGAASTFVGLDGDTLKALTLSEDEWRKRLTPAEFNVLREEGTERAFTSPLNDEKHDGTFVCAGCQLPLFSSETKFNSGTGWPSFYAPIDEANVREVVDNSYGMRRVEVECARCGGHQGHIFDDGPKPTGLRYCINGVALQFVSAE